MDKKYVQRILLENISELKINAFAMVRGRNSRVREVARRFFECYSANHVNTIRVVQDRHMKIAVEPERADCLLLEGLKLAHPAAFDRVYVQTVARRQREAISLARAELQDGRDPAIKELASRLLHQLEEHLDVAIRIIKAQTA
jgi:putative membrane protein